MGKLGSYLYQQLIHFATKNKQQTSWINSETRVMGDSGAIGVLFNKQKRYYTEINAPINNEYCESNYRKIRVYY